MSTGNPQFGLRKIPDESSELVEDKKRAEWIRRIEEINKEADATGKGIEKGIKEIVGALNMNSISTSQSCEGHLEVERGHRPWPWVSVAAPNEPEDRFIGEKQAFEDAARKHNVSLEELKKGIPGELYWEIMGQISQNEVTPEYQGWERNNEELYKKVVLLLDEFYEDRKVNPDVKLKAEESNGGSFEISSEKMPIVKFLEGELTEEEKKKLLELLPVRQEEMRWFTSFLVSKFFETEKEFESYVEDLQLTSEDFQKKILDVGSGSGLFAKWAKDKNINSNIFSLDPIIKKEERTKSVQAIAQAIPFKDEAFDLVISNCSIPNIFLDMGSVKEKVRDSLLEMLRVTKSGGEIRLGRVFLRHEYKSQRELTGVIEEIAEELKKNRGVKIDVSHSKGANDTFLIKIHKPLKVEKK